MALLCGLSCLLLVFVGALAPFYFVFAALVRRGRFSMLTMFGLSTVVCVDLAIARYLTNAKDFSNPNDLMIFGIWAVIVSGFSVAVVGTLWFVWDEFVEIARFGGRKSRRSANVTISLPAESKDEPEVPPNEHA